MHPGLTIPADRLEVLAELRARGEGAVDVVLTDSGSDFIVSLDLMRRLLEPTAPRQTSAVIIDPVTGTRYVPTGEYRHPAADEDWLDLSTGHVYSGDRSDEGRVVILRRFA